MDEGFFKGFESHVHFVAAYGLDEAEPEAGVVEKVTLGKVFPGAIVTCLGGVR